MKQYKRILNINSSFLVLQVTSQMSYFNILLWPILLKISDSFRLIELSSDPESIAARRAVRRKILEQNVSLIATLEDDQNNDKRLKIMGTLILLVNVKNDPPIKVRNKIQNT